MSYDALLRGRYSAPGQAYVVTTVCAGRQTFFLDLMRARAAIVEIRRLHDRGEVNSLAFVVMPDHVHWMFELGEGRALRQVIQDFKGRTARSVNRRLGQSGLFWLKGYYEHALRAEEDLRSRARYIVANPLRAGLAREVGAYLHWDAAWLDEALSG